MFLPPNVRQISSITVQTLDTNLVASRRIEGEEASLPVNLYRSKTALLKTPMANVELIPVFTGIKENMIYLLLILIFKFFLLALATFSLQK